MRDIKNDLYSSGYTNVDFEIYGAQELLDLENGNEEISDILEYKQSFKYVTAGTNEKKLNGHIAIVKGDEIAKLVEKFQNALFELNIRDFYTNNPNNGRIIETASSEEESKFFWSFNNGLTVTCKEVEDLPENKLKVSGMQIVNGCQTSNSIYKAYSNRKRYEELIIKDELTKKEEEEIDKIKNYCLDYNTSVLVKIIETQDEDLVYRITESTNSQTAISSFSIKANEDIHKNIETFMKDYSIYYERRVNYYRNQKDISTKDIIDIKKMSQVFMSMIKIHPSQAMSSPKAMFINNYKTIFPDPGINHGKDYKLYLIPALVQQNVEQKIKNIQRRKKEKKLFNKKILSYGKFHLGCFILSSILDTEYNERGISVRFEEIRNILEDSTLFDIHFEYAVVKLKEALIDMGCDNEDAVSQYLRSKDIDNKIATMVRGRKMVRTSKVKVESK
ncbi:AIPR protein (fragment) [Bacillus sp. 349Y]